MTSSRSPAPPAAVDRQTPHEAAAVGTFKDRQQLQRWAGRLGLALLPLVLVLAPVPNVSFGPYRFGSYYGNYLWEGLADLPSGGDHDFYLYQTGRMVELEGRWWQLGQDDLLGRPYPSVMARFMELYEGVEVLLVSTVTGRALDPLVNYHLLVVLVLLFNGWVAGWLVRRLTGSYLWAAVGVVLITWNTPTEFRINGHMHLVKYGWVLLAVWAFSRYLDTPSLGRGLWLGTSAALVLQSSYFFGFLLVLAFGIWWLGCLLSGRLNRHHFLALGAGALIAGLLAFALTFPVWSYGREQVAAAGAEKLVFNRPRAELWGLSSELWQYVVSPRWTYGHELYRGKSGEGWNYVGLTVLAALAVYAGARLRGWRLCEADPRFLDRALGLAAIWVVLSLTGGPAVLLHDVVPWFRAYGRSGLLAVAVLSVAAPVILHGAAQRLSHSALRGAVVAGALALALLEGSQRGHANGPLALGFGTRGPDPAWVDWLARQPADVRLIAFPFPQGIHEYAAAAFRLRHRHATLNGCEEGLLGTALDRIDSSFDTLGPDGLWLMAAQGYNTLAFQRDYLDENPWIKELSWLGTPEEVGDWIIYRMPETPQLYEVSAVGPMRWKGDPAEESAWHLLLPKQQFVSAIRLRYACENGAPRSSIRIAWRRSDRNDFADLERSAVLDLKAGDGARSVVIPVSDRIDELRIRPEDRPCVLDLEELVLLVPSPREHKARLNYRQVIDKIREAVQTLTPAGAVVLVVTNGDPDFLQFEGRRGWYFPQTQKGEYGGKPVNSKGAIDHLESLRGKGARYLVLPRDFFWWFDHYTEFRQHLEKRYRVAARLEDAYVIYELR